MGNTRYVYIQSLFLWLALAPTAIRAGMSMSMGQSMEQRLEMSQRQEMRLAQVLSMQIQQSQKLTLSLLQKTGVFDPLVEVLEDLPSYVEEGAVEEKTAQLNKSFRPFRYYKAVPGKTPEALATLLERAGGGVFLPGGEIILIDGRFIPESLEKIVAVHEFGEYVFQGSNHAHEFATVLEFVFASRNKKLKPYVEWTEFEHFDKALNTADVASDALAAVFNDKEFRDAVKEKSQTAFWNLDHHPFFQEKRLPDADPEKLRNYLGVGSSEYDEHWMILWPESLIAMHQRAKDRTQQFRQRITNFFQTLESIAGQRTDSEEQRGKLFQQETQKLRHWVQDNLNGAFDVPKMVGFWKDMREGFIRFAGSHTSLSNKFHQKHTALGFYETINWKRDESPYAPPGIVPHLNPNTCGGKLGKLVIRRERLRFDDPFLTIKQQLRQMEDLLGD